MNIQASAEELTRLAAFGQAVLQLVQEGGFLKATKRRKARAKKEVPEEDRPLSPTKTAAVIKKLKKKRRREREEMPSSLDSDENS